MREASWRELSPGAHCTRKRKLKAYCTPVCSPLLRVVARQCARGPTEKRRNRAAPTMQLHTRMQREVKMMQTEPPPGVWAAPKNGERLTELEAQIQARAPGGRAPLTCCWR